MVALTPRRTWSLTLYLFFQEYYEYKAEHLCPLEPVSRQGNGDGDGGGVLFHEGVTGKNTWYVHKIT